MDNTVSIEKIRIRDIFSAIGAFFSTSKDIENDEEINKKLQMVYKVEEEIGATKGIKQAEKSLEKLVSKTSGRKAVKKVNSIKVPNQEIDSIKNEDIDMQVELEK